MILLPLIIGTIAGEVIKKNNPGLNIFVLSTPGRRIGFSILIGLAATGLVATGKRLLT